MRLLLAISLLCLTACVVSRVPAYSPHRSATPEHRAARSNADCRGCHDPAQLADHAPGDDCLNCHKLCQGC